MRIACVLDVDYEDLITSRQPSDIPTSIRESLKLLERVLVGSR